jgi:hypothetical protein
VIAVNLGRRVQVDRHRAEDLGRRCAGAVASRDQKTADEMTAAGELS